MDDEALLTFLADLQAALPSVCVEAPTPEDRLYVLVTLARLWEDQAQRRYRAKPVRIPDPILQKLQSCCANLPEVQRQLFHLLDHLHRASSGVGGTTPVGWASGAECRTGELKADAGLGQPIWPKPAGIRISCRKPYGVTVIWLVTVVVMLPSGVVARSATL